MDTTMGAYEAKTHFSGLLDRVEGGETVTITRNGKPVARLVPAEVAPAREEAGSVVAQFRAFRDSLRQSGVKPFTLDELLGMVREGRK